MPASPEISGPLPPKVQMPIKLAPTEDVPSQSLSPSRPVPPKDTSPGALLPKVLKVELPREPGPAKIVLPKPMPYKVAQAKDAKTKPPDIPLSNLISTSVQLF